MKGHAFGWLILLFLIQNFSCEIYPKNPFKLRDTNLTATEGSCIEIKCQVSESVNANQASWFWMKDPVWMNGGFSATTIFSSSESKHPVSARFAKRVKYVGSPSTSWNSPSPQLCSILIHDLNKNDTGNYSFRYVATFQNYVWATQPFMNLTVTENPCLLTFEEPKDVTEHDNVTLTCSTSSSCTSGLKIEGPSASLSQSKSENPKKTTLSFSVTWEDDGRMFSCQTENNTDPCLIRNISLTVGYAPKNVSANISSKVKEVKEGDRVTFTCSAKGQPEPSFTWTKNDGVLCSVANCSISSINESQSGLYTCKAENKHGSEKSEVTVEVTYAPVVDIVISQEHGRMPKPITQGDKVTFTCSVKRSKPQPHSFTWLKDNKLLDSKSETVVKIIQPEDSGNYKCSAKNTVGSGSKTIRLTVQYKPRKTSISIGETSVKINASISFICVTDANPAPFNYSWFRYKQTDPSWKKMLMVSSKTLSLGKVQRADEACYICNASNRIDKGDTSKPVCIEVLFPPNNTNLYMTEVVTEGEPVRVRCTAESFPPPSFTLMRPSTSNSQTPTRISLSNNSSYEFKAISTDAGLYTCNASNSEGYQQSPKKKLVVKYSPKEVKIKAHPDLTVKENESLTLDCSANSYPSVNSITWMKMTDGMGETIISTRTPLTVSSASLSDIGNYSCMVTNEIGTGKSKQVEVNVMYGPKFTKIEKVEEALHDDVTTVTLSCISQCYPKVTQYSWYKRIDKKEIVVSESQDISVSSDQPGEYYCVAKNEIGERSSEPIHLFDDTVMKIVKVALLCLILLILCILIFLYRRRRNNLNHQGTTNVWPWRRFLGSWNSVSRSSGNQSSLAEPFRSRDDLLPDQPCQPNAQRHQLHPDSTTASNTNTIYSAVNLPKGIQAASAQNPITGHGENVGNDSLNYTSVFFVNRKKDPEEDVEYSVVSKPKKSKVTEEERQEDYENISEVHPPKPPYTYDFDSDTDTSEDEVQVNYSHVNFQPKSGHQRAKKDSSSSTEDETQYSQVKI